MGVGGHVTRVCAEMVMFWSIMGVLVMAVFLQTGLQHSGADEDVEQSETNSIVNIKSFYNPTPPVQPKLLSDPIFNEMLVPLHNSSKRASWDFYAMIKCGTGCNPLVYKGYGCYCGFLGSGNTVDGIDSCASVTASLSSAWLTTPVLILRPCACPLGCTFRTCSWASAREWECNLPDTTLFMVHLTVLGQDHL